MFDDVSIPAYILRLIHILTVVTLVGGILFMRLVLAPVADKVLSGDMREQLHAALIGFWKYFVHAGIALLVISGFLNYLVFPGRPLDGKYHMILGIKILIALGVFVISSALVGKTPAFEGIRRRHRLWLTVNIGLILIVIAMSSFLKVRPTVPKVAASAAAAVEKSQGGDKTAVPSDDEKSE
jgi:uncharacterized membrane protein